LEISNNIKIIFRLLGHVAGICGLAMARNGPVRGDRIQMAGASISPTLVTRNQQTVTKNFTGQPG